MGGYAINGKYAEVDLGAVIHSMALQLVFTIIIILLSIAIRTSILVVASIQVTGLKQLLLMLQRSYLCGSQQVTSSMVLISTLMKMEMKNRHILPIWN